MKRLTLDEVKQRIKDRFPNEDFEIVLFQGMGEKGSVRCLCCGEVIVVNKFSNFFAKNKVNGCKNCKGIHIQRDLLMQQLLQDYDFIDSFVKDTHTNYILKCKECGHQRTTTLSNFKRRPKCGCQLSGVKRGRTAEHFLKEVNESCREGFYVLESEYLNQQTPVKIRHSCGFLWEVRPADILHGRSFCPSCGRKESFGEHMVKLILQDERVSFSQQVRLEDSLQRFDFAIYEGGNIVAAIEYNGKQHYEEVPFFRASLEEQMERDERKRVYCRERGIHLLEIRFDSSERQIREEIHKFLECL